MQFCVVFLFLKGGDICFFRRKTILAESYFLVSQPKHMFELLDKKIFTIYAINILLSMTHVWNM